MVDRSKKRRREGMRFKERRERVRSKVRSLFMTLFPGNNRDFRKSAIALRFCFLSIISVLLANRFWTRFIFLQTLSSRV